MVPGWVSKVDERQSILVPVVLKALIDMGLVSVETTVPSHGGEGLALSH